VLFYYFLSNIFKELKAYAFAPCGSFLPVCLGQQRYNPFSNHQIYFVFFIKLLSNNDASFLKAGAKLKQVF
jgi:hypothetical protein